MSSYPSETDLIAALDRGDRLVCLCAAGRMSFDDFCTEYDNLYWSLALDGHESDESGLAVLAKHAARIAIHQAVAETILANVGSHSAALPQSFRVAGRFGPVEAVARLELVAAGLRGGEA